MDAATESWATEIEAVRAEAAGLFTVTVIRPQDGPRWLAAAFAGDPGAQRTMRAIRHMMRNIKRSRRTQPVLCGCCPQPIRHADGAISFVVAEPQVEAPSQCIVIALCYRCTAFTTTDKALEALRRLWPEARRIDAGAIHPGGVA